MPSSINPFNVDGTFPIAGQDNSSQGFRDNFTSIQNNFISAKSEIDDLQKNAILISPLSGQTLNNDMAGTVLTRPQLQSWTQKPYTVPSGSSATFDFSIANFQIFQTLGDGTSTAIDFVSPPVVVGTGTTGYGVMRVWFKVQSTADTIILPSSVTYGLQDIAGYNPTTRAISFSATGTYVFDFSSINTGTDYLITEITRRGQTGNLTVRGTKVETGYQYAAPSTNFSADIYANVARYLMDPTTTITNGNLKLPAGVVDGTVIEINSTATITNLSVWGGDGVTVAPSANVTLSAGTGIKYFYHAVETKWYKIG